VAIPSPTLPTQSGPVALDDRLRELETNLITWALAMSHGNKSKAAELLKIKRSTLGDRLARCGLAIGETHERVPSEIVERA
jgi:DNA-binding NtrC family response regulator